MLDTFLKAVVFTATERDSTSRTELKMLSVQTKRVGEKISSKTLNTFYAAVIKSGRPGSG